jgi:hypothetical protein
MWALKQLKDYHTNPEGTHIYLDPLEAGKWTWGHAKSTFGIPAQVIHVTNKNTDQLNLTDNYLQFASKVYWWQQEIITTLWFDQILKNIPQWEIHLHAFMHHPDLTNPYIAQILWIDTKTLDTWFSFNNKDTFQKTVMNVLWENHATWAEYMGMGDDANKLYEKVKDKINASPNKKAVLRVADFNRAPGWGQWVLICSNPNQIVEFLKRNDMLSEDWKNLKSTILIENFLPHTHTPTQTFFTDYNGNVEHVSTNYQFVSPEWSFLASTNIIPTEIQSAVWNMTDTSLQLMEKLASQWVRWWWSIDHMYNSKTWKNIKWEANLRESGTSIPNETALKLTNFVEQPENLWRVYMRDIYYNNKLEKSPLSYSNSISSITHLLDKLRNTWVLIEDKNSIDDGKVQVMIDYTSDTYDHFDLVFVRNKTKLQDLVALQQVNTILDTLNINQSLSFPS